MKSESTDKKDRVHRVYNRFIRPYTPHKIGVYNGVPVKSVSRILDFQDQFPDYEAPLVSALRTHVQSGDDVVIVGGGIGVSTVAAIEATGRRGSVETFEGSASQYETVIDTVELNLVEEHVDVHHAVVGSFSDYSTESYGDTENAAIVPPAELPACDVLEMDCEGAELEILEEMEISPRVIVVETHGLLGSPEADVREVLDERGYEVIDRGVELAAEGVYILTAVRQDR